MEFMKGIQRKETVELADLLSGDYTGKTVSLNGAVHTIRDMGEVSFVILRKAEGLVQCVRERSVPVYRAGERGAGAAQEAADGRLEFVDNGPEIPSAELKEESAVTVTEIGRAHV